MNKIKLTTCGILLATCGYFSTAAAEDGNYAIEGFVGKAKQSNSLAGFQTLSGYDTSKGLRGVIGLNRVIDLELGYTDFGTAMDESVDEFGELITDTLDSSAFQVGIRGTIPLSSKLSLVGRAGIALWELDYRQTDSAFPGDAYTDGDEGADAYFGVGLRVKLERNMHLGLEYNSLDFKAALGEANTTQDISNFGLSLGWSF